MNQKSEISMSMYVAQAAITAMPAHKNPRMNLNNKMEEDPGCLATKTSAPC